MPSSEPLALGSHPSLRRLGIVAAALVVALVLAGQIIFFTHALRSGVSVPGNVPVVPRTGSLQHRLDLILSTVLGPSDRGVRRFSISTVTPHAGDTPLKDVAITWSINNDISAGTVANGAATDVYAMMRAIYTAPLPVARVSLRGTYPESRSSGRERTVLRLGMDRDTAATVQDYGWDNLDPQTLWPLLNRSYVARDFAPLSSE